MCGFILTQTCLLLRIYVDVVLNHMTSNWGDAIGTGENKAFTDVFLYPAVPYGPDDFHHPTCSIASDDYANNATAVSVKLPLCLYFTVISIASGGSM